MTTPRVSVVVPAHDAGQTLGRALAALAAQRVEGGFEVILVDDGSTDDTLAIARAAELPLTIVSGDRLGAAEARNRGVLEARAQTLAFTDADCEPAPEWLAAGLAALGSADLVQGRVVPRPGEPLGPFDRTLWVEAARGFFETANLFVTRELFERLGGFEQWVEMGGRPFGEDLWFGWRAVRGGARTSFEPRALVHHAVFPRGPLAFVDERRRLRHFPAIARRVPEVRERMLYRRVFLTRRSAALDAALAGAALAAVRRSPVGLLAAAPYAWMVAKAARPYRRRAPLVAAVGVAADLTGCAAMLYGSLRFRSPVV